MSFVGAHNAGGSSFACLEFTNATTGEPENTCNIAQYFPVECTFGNQHANLSALLAMGVRWLDMAFVGYNPVDPTQAYTAHNSDTTEFGIAYGDSAAAVFETVGSFLSLSMNRNEVVVLWLKAGEMDEAIQQPDGPNGYNSFYDTLRNSTAARFLLGSPSINSTTGNFSWPTVGDLVHTDKRLVVMGWPTIPADIGVNSTQWLVDSWSNGQNASALQSEAKSACVKGKPVILQEVLSFNGNCVETRAANEVFPIIDSVVESCENIFLTILTDFLSENSTVFDLVVQSIKSRS
ncbi:hypothetical protein HDU82_004736 [Entophlyctis luteolus]|nr:hypothetical protein HDU82_004736 [Entophlyctis luteolus]